MNIDRTELVLVLLLVAAGWGAVVMLSRRVAAESIEPDAGSSRSALGRLSDILRIAVFFGLATGALQVLLALINRYVLDRFLMAGPQMFWMTPVAYALIFGAMGTVPALLVAARPRIELRRSAVLVFAALGVFSLLLPFPQLHKAARTLFAIGVGLQIWRAMATRLPWWLSVMRRTIVRAAIALLLVAAGSELWPIAAERYALSRLPAAPGEAPNVLLIVLDTVRARSLSLYGYQRPTTPGLERLAREGTTFDFAMSTAPWTLKSHGTVFTGLYPDEIEGDFEHPMEFRTPVLADEFSKRGYLTTGIVANLLYASRESGLARGFVHYDDYHLSARQLFMHSWIAHTPLARNVGNSRTPRDLWNAISHPGLGFDLKDFNSRTYGLRSANLITTAFLDWQAAQPKRPFYAFLNYFDAHWPYQSPPDFQRRFALADRPFRGRYDAAIAYIDSEVERLLTELRKRGVLDNTIVVITSDHGEQFVAHGLTQHANSLYTQLLHVPLLIRYPPAVPAGVRVTSAVSLRDLPATLVRLAGLAGAEFPGVSLAGWWRFGAMSPEGSIPLAELSDAVRPTPGSPAAFGPMRSVFDQQFHYIRRGDGAEELFDYRADPAEASDLSQTAAGKRRLAELRLRLEFVTRPGSH